jgi:ribonuclease Z
MTTDVIITGTGVPNVAPGRAGAGVLVRHGDCLLQFDAGRATTLRLVEAGVSTGSLTALFVTHHHSDHLVGLQDLLFTRWVENHGHHTPLPVVAPDGPCVTYLERMMDPWADDIEIRQVHADRSDPPDPEIVAFSPGTEPSVVWEHDRVRVLAVAVHHEPVLPAVAYRIETPDGAVVISGDTRVCEEVATLAADADVLVHEVFRRAVMAPLAEHLPHLHHIADYHADSEELGAMAGRIQVPTLVLTHLIPPPRNEADEASMADEVRGAGYQGAIIVARDLTKVSL